MKIHIDISAVIVALSMLFSKNPSVWMIFLFTAALHEAGHIIASKILKIKLKKITLGAAGAILTPQSDLGSYKQELLLSAAGPAANITVAAISYLHLVIIRGSFPKLEEIFLSSAAYLSDNSNGDIEAMLSLAVVFSILQAAINLLPVSTLDGGRMFFCIAATLSNLRTAEWASSVISSLSAFAIWTVSVYILLKANRGLGIFAFSLCIFARIVQTGKESLKNPKPRNFFQNTY